MAIKKSKTFCVMAKIQAEMDVEIQAEDLDQALAKSKEMVLTDFVGICPGDTIDCNLEVTGVFKVHAD